MNHVPLPKARAAWFTYLGSLGVLNLFWETAQLPLYTIWSEASAVRLAFVVLHCTVGDLLIASLSLAGANLLTGWRWPESRIYWPTAMLASSAGLAYTFYSEWFNVAIRETWVYSPAMPLLPPLGTGLSPLLQWVLLPPLGFYVAHRCRVSGGTGQKAAAGKEDVGQCLPNRRAK